MMRYPLDPGRWLCKAASLVWFALVAGPVSAAQEAASAVQEAASATVIQRAASGNLLSLPNSRFWLILVLIALMAYLFKIIFIWQQKIEQSGYFSKIFQDSVKNIDYIRLSSLHNAKWIAGDYVNEIFLRRSDRGEAWTKADGLPKPSDELFQIATYLGYEYVSELLDVQRSEDRPRAGLALTESGGRNPFEAANRRPGGSGSGIGALGGSWSASDPTNRTPEEVNALQEQKVRQEKIDRFEAQLRNFRREVEDWGRRARACAWGWYQADLQKAENEADRQASLALTVDFSALRGRGPEFVLEFTALVVIIFAAVILGFVDVLKGEQIGTLLAAIAGYVLGKGATRASTSPGPNQGGPKPDNTAKVGTVDKQAPG